MSRASKANRIGGLRFGVGTPNVLRGGFAVGTSGYDELPDEDQLPSYRIFDGILHVLLLRNDGLPLQGADGSYLYGVA
jgi:hypothetical protein